MVLRTSWLERIERAWKLRPIVWLRGIRRAGKTVLCQSLPDCLYYDCELPSVRRLLEQPEAFLAERRGRRMVLDEIHRLPNPSEFLKIAADHFPRTRVLATGSSTLGSSAKFRDTLAGRKVEVWLTPMNTRDLADFRSKDLKRRLFHGGLPGHFLARRIPASEFQEWMDSYWARDIQELFRLERRYSFQRFAELLFIQSGGLFEATRFAGPCEVSRPTITSYLKTLADTSVVNIIRPFNSHRAKEIIAVPKVYAFDTGFVCFHRGWERLRHDDLGTLWEHYVLNEIHSCLPERSVFYWRDKQKHEIDFILPGRGAAPPVAVECKWSADRFDPGNLLIFRRLYPKGASFVVANDVKESFTRSYRGVAVRFVSLEGFIEAVPRPMRRGAAPTRSA